MQKQSQGDHTIGRLERSLIIIIIIIIVLIGAFINLNLSKSTQSAVELKSLKPAASGAT